MAKKMPRYPVPVALIGHLAVDVKFQQQRCWRACCKGRRRI